MSGSRETASLWYWLFKEDKNYPRFKRTFKKLISNPYFWSDSFGRYLNRYLVCKIVGHRNTMWIDDNNSIRNLHCFHCASNTESRVGATISFKDDNQKPYARN